MLARTMVQDLDLRPPQQVFSAIRQTVLDSFAEYDLVRGMEERAIGQGVAEGPRLLYAGIRVPIRLNMTIGLLSLEDRLEWQLVPMSREEPFKAEDFVTGYIKELALPREFS